MSPGKLKKLIKLGKNLDNLDNSLIKLVKKRTEIVKKVLKLKEYKNQIVDKKRIKVILNQIRSKSIRNNIDTKVTNKIWSNISIGFSDLGLSEVKITYELNSETKFPINGLFFVSLSPPHPTTVINLWSMVLILFIVFKAEVDIFNVIHLSSSGI